MHSPGNVTQVKNHKPVEYNAHRDLRRASAFSKALTT